MKDLSAASSGWTDLLRIGGATKIYAVIGDPIAHSVSPPILNAAFRSMNMDFAYVAFRVRKDELKKAIGGIRSLGIPGANVTIPHKTRVLRFLDTIDKTAREIGAVNTIVRKESRLCGYNTDGQGALAALLRLGTSLSGNTAVILGAGGASRAIAYHLSKVVEKMTILNRTRSKASNIAANITTRNGTKCRACGLSKGELRREVGRANLLINTLPVDVFPRYGEILIRERLVGRGMLVMDVNYRPKSDFLAEAQRAGAKTTDGLDMLVEQAALSFTLWTGRDAPIEVMREAAIRAKATW